MVLPAISSGRSNQKQSEAVRSKSAHVLGGVDGDFEGQAVPIDKRVERRAVECRRRGAVVHLRERVRSGEMGGEIEGRSGEIVRRS